MMGTMSMYYVTDPDNIVTSIQSLLDVPEWERKIAKKDITKISTHTVAEPWAKKHTSNTRWHVRDILQ
jgi:hypothetical protein